MMGFVVVKNTNWQLCPGYKKFNYLCCGCRQQPVRWQQGPASLSVCAHSGLRAPPALAHQAAFPMDNHSQLSETRNF